MSTLLPPIGALAIRFLERTVLDLQTLRSLLKQVRAGKSDALARVASIAHSIHGTGASLGHQSVSDCAGKLEQRVKQQLATPEPPPLDELRALVGQLDIIVTESLTRLKIRVGSRP